MLRRKLLICLLFLIGLAGTLPVQAASPSATSNSLTYQGRILKSDGTPFEYSNVSFIFQILDPAGSCLIYQEQISGYNMVNSGGVFDVPIGTGSIQYISGSGGSVVEVFNNSAAYTCGSCVSNGTSYNCSSTSTPYNPLISDGRILRVSFYDGSGWKTISPDNAIRAVPFAGYSVSAQKLGNNVAADFLKIAGIPTCGPSTFLSWNGSALTCESVSGASGGTVTSISTGTGLTGGPITSAGTISLANTSVSAGAYGSSTQVATFTVDAQGRLTAAGNTTISGVTPGGSASGDLSGSYPNPTVAKLQGTAVSATAPTSGNFLKYNGTSWQGSSIKLGDLKSSVSGNLFSSPNCSSSQTLSWNSGSDQFTCISIGGLDSSVITSGTLPTSTLPAFTGDVTSSAGSTTLTLSNSGVTAGTYKSVTVDAKGRVTGGANPTTLAGYGITDGVLKTGDTMTGSLSHAANTGNTYTAGSGTNTVTLQGPSGAIGTSYVLRLPPAQSTGSQALINDGSGNLSWQTLTSGTVTSVGATSPLISSGGANPTVSLAGLTGLGAANQILGMNNGATGYEYKSLNGTSNQISITQAAGSITLGTPQNIHTGASPTFNGMTLSGMTTAGFVKNNASGVLSGGNQVNLTSDVSGQLPVANGGTGAGSFAGYSVIAANATGSNFVAVPGTVNGSILQYSPTGPSWSTASYPTSTTANQILYSSTNNVVGGLSTANNALLTTNGSGVPSWQALSTDLLTQYALLAGRGGGQTLNGGTAASNNLTLDSTSHTTKGNILLAPSGGNVGIGTSSPGQKLSVAGIIESTTGGLKFPDGSTQAATAFGPVFSAYASTASSAGGTYVKIPYDTIEFDTDNSFITASNRFQPARAGYYRVNLNLTLSMTTGNGGFTLFLDLRKNGTVLRTTRQLISYSSPFTQTLQVNTLVYLNGTTDYLEGWYMTNNGTASILTGGDLTSFSGQFVRP